MIRRYLEDTDDKYRIKNCVMWLNILVTYFLKKDF